LNIVNATWGQDGYAFLPSYLDVLGENYGAPMYLLDFAGDPEGSRGVINGWVEERTENRIEELIPMGIITPITTLVLTNAIYFNAAWNAPFEPSDTSDGAFTRLDGSTVTVPMMSQDEEHRYGEGDGYQAVELAYDEPNLAMVLVLPSEGRFDEVEANLSEETYQAITSSLSEHAVALTMPKFEYESAFGLNEALMALGMTDAFSGAADFSGMDGTRSLFIQAVLHKAFVSVNEAGTEAAAATAVVVGRVSIPEPAEITLDRPFLYFIVDRPTGEILFLGRVLDPSA
jgi:serpin B